MRLVIPAIMLFTLALVAFTFVGCNRAEIGCPNAMTTYMIEAGKFYCSPRVFYAKDDRNPEGEWSVTLQRGWEYELPSNQSQWLKLCGDSFERVLNDHNSVMLGARYYDGVLQVAPYYNVEGERRWASGDDWPIVVVDTGKEIRFSYEAVDDVINTTIKYKGKTYRHSMEVPHENYFREINFYGGGSVAPVTTLTIKKKRFCNEGS